MLNAAYSLQFIDPSVWMDELFYGCTFERTLLLWDYGGVGRAFGL